jgi:hypothetical protein
MKDKLQLHSFPHATHDFYARSMLSMHHVSNRMVLVSKQVALNSSDDCILCSMVSAGWFIVGYFFSSPKVNGVFLVGSSCCIDDMAGRRQSPHGVGDYIS